MVVVKGSGGCICFGLFDHLSLIELDSIARLVFELARLKLKDVGCSMLPIGR